MKKNGMLSKFAMMLAVALLATSCSSSTKNEKKAEKNEADQVLRVAINPYLNSLPNVIIQQNKLDEKYGFKMETTMFSSGATMNEALAADEWDVGEMGAAAVTGVANYDMLVIGEVLESLDGLGIFAKPDSEIAKSTPANSSIKDIKGNADTVKGKTISLPVGTAQHFTTLKWLGELGLTSNDVNIVNMDSAQAYQSLVAGEVDLTALNVPTFLKAKEDGMVEVGNLANLGTRYVDMICANRKIVENNPELVGEYLKAFFEANEIIESDKDKAADIMYEWLKSEGSETSKEDNLADLKRANYFSYDQMKERVKDGKFGNFAKELGNFYIEQGQLVKEDSEKFDNNIIDKFFK